MSSKSPMKRKHEWIIILPDHGGVLERRMQVRQRHLEAIAPKMDEGFLKLGGAILEEEQKDGDSLKIKGSVMLAVAESKEEVLEVLKADIYSTSGIWDLGKMEIYPFKTALMANATTA